jgi:DNA repair exonuclease SbcCD nuclease subunit
VPTGRPLTILQSSDWHAGSALTGGGLGLPPDVRAQRREDVDAAAERAVRAAVECGAEALLVPGDLWDAENVAAATIHRLLEALASFAPKPVFVAPGNHDFAGAGGYYDPSLLAALGMRAWPDNVVVFRGPSWETVSFPGREDVAVTGKAFLSPAVVVERPLAPPPPRPPVPHALLLLHGSLESYPGADSPRGTKRTAPFSRREVVDAGFSWAALGHHHHVHLVEDDAGVPRGAYSGSPTGRGLDEAGRRVFLKVTLVPDESPRVETLSADTRTIHDLAADVTDLEAAAFAGRLETTWGLAGVGAGDLVRLTLTGTQPHGARPGEIARQLAPAARHVAIRDLTSPPAEDAGLRSAEGRFVADLTARRDAAEEEGSRRVAELALRLGRDALAGRPVLPPEPEEA